MKSKWVFHKLAPHLPSWLFSAISPFNSQKIFQLPFLGTQKLVLNYVEVSSLLSVCGREGLLRLGSSLHASVVKNPELFSPENCCSSNNALVVWNSLLAMYAKSGALMEALKLFDEMQLRDTCSWNTVISGLLRNGDLERSFRYFEKLHKSGVYQFDAATLTTLLSACDEPELCYVGKIIHGLVFSSGYENDISVGNALITFYLKCGFFNSGTRVFNEMSERNVVTWTAVMSGLVQNQLYKETLELFVMMRLGSVNPNSLTYLSSLMACSGLQALNEGCQIHALLLKLGIESDFCVESALMDMYSKCGIVNDAWKIFESAQELDEISMTVILTGLAQNGFEEEAVQFFVKVFKTGIDVDANMVSAILGVFGDDTSLGLGKQIHSLIIKRSFSSNPFVSNGLINMYSKCGELEEAAKVFSRMSGRNSISWNSMIAAFARHGDASKALQLYEEMRLDDVEPTDITFLSLLHACSHVGLVEKGMEFLKSMTEIHRLTPRTQHYSCVVDMLGRAGLLKEAKTFIEDLPMKPDILLWQALLGACSIYGNSEIGKYAAEQWLMADPENPVPYTLMANIYSSQGKWRDRATTIKKMKEMGVTKEIGISWIEIEKQVHSFVVADRMHPETETIYGVLMELFRLMLDEGYAPDKRFLLHYMNQDGTHQTLPD